MKYSVIVPVYNEEDSLVELTDRICHVFDELAGRGEYEIVFVDDGSTDDSMQVIDGLAQREMVQGVFFRRNSGKAAALMAGGLHCEGETIVTIDADLQDRPEDIPAMIEKLEQDKLHLVVGWRTNREDTLSKRILSRIFNSAVTRMSGLRLHDMNCGLKVIRRKTFNTLRLYGQNHRFLALQTHMLGFKVGEIPVTNEPRKHGVSKYSTLRSFSVFDLISTFLQHRFHQTPLYFFGVISAVLIIPSLLLLGMFSTQQILHWVGFDVANVPNRPLLLISSVAVLTGVNVFLTGVVCDFALRSRMEQDIDQMLAGIIDRTTLQK